MPRRSGVRFEVEDSAGRRQKPLVIGLTGGIGSGKSTVAERFQVLGVPIIDADVIAREVVEPGQPALARIIDTFGGEVLDSQGRLDRGALRRLVFANPERRKTLEALLHPLIREEMRRRVQKTETPYCILSIPLLVESGQRDMVDRILVVDAPEALQLQRARARDKVSTDEVEAVMRAQVDKQTRLAAADDVIVNDQGLNELYRQVDALHQRYLQLARAPASDDVVPQDPPRPQRAAAEARIESAPLLSNDQGDASVVYEFPLNERIRTLLRLECLFQQAGHYRRGENSWDSRAAVTALLDLLEAFSRVDFKKELLQEMERLAGALSRYLPMQGVDKTRLETLLRELQGLSQAIHALNGPIGQNLRQHEMLNAVRQRAVNAACLCGFDLPVYCHWLSQPVAQRQADLNEWFAELEPLRKAAEFTLELIRNSGRYDSEEAKGGYFQRTLEPSQPYQLIQVRVPRDVDYYVEISGGRHRFSVRMMQPRGDSRAVQINQDIQFLVNCCAI